MSNSYGVTEYPNTFKRQAAFSLDSTSTYTNYNEAEQYAHESPIAYAGQIISVYENDITTVYTLNADSTGTYNFILTPIKSSEDYTNIMDEYNTKLDTLLTSVNDW